MKYFLEGENIRLVKVAEETRRRVTRRRTWTCGEAVRAALRDKARRQRREPNGRFAKERPRVEAKHAAGNKTRGFQRFFVLAKPLDA